MKSYLLACLLLASNLPLFAGQVFGATIFVNSSSSRLTIIDTDSPEDAIELPSDRSWYDIAISQDGELFVALSSSALYRVDPETGEEQESLTRTSRTYNGLTFDDGGALWFSGGTAITSWDMDTGEIFRGDTEGPVSAGDLEFDAAGNLYMTATDGSLYSISRSTGNATLIGQTPYDDFWGLAYTDGTMYGFRGDEAHTIDLRTAETELLFTFGSSNREARGATAVRGDCPLDICVQTNSVARLLPVFVETINTSVSFVWPVDPANPTNGHDGPCGDWPDDSQGCFWLSEASELAGEVWRDVQPHQRHLNETFGQYHLGADYNLGGGSDDAGLLVYPAAPGRIDPGAILENVCGWGNIVFVEHATIQGPITTMYAHVDWLESGPPTGGLVDSTTPIARIGNGEWNCGSSQGNYPYHLHFEVREGRSTTPGNGYTVERLNDGQRGPQGQVDPNSFIVEN